MMDLRKFTHRVAAGAASVACGAAAAMAQGDIVRPPKAEDPGEVSFIVVTGVALLCAAVIFGINVLPSRRTHQD